MPTSHLDPSGLATTVELKRSEADDSQRDLAEALDINRSIVSRALNHPSTRDIRTLRRALEHYGADTEGPYYRVTFD